uniref:Uncharacterized protein n=5 Tax=Aegilops tauschii subsp. strangulata TaxID=200361 RepID=A0A453N563_AEGTS
TQFTPRTRRVRHVLRRLSPPARWPLRRAGTTPGPPPVGRRRAPTACPRFSSSCPTPRLPAPPLPVSLLALSSLSASPSSSPHGASLSFSSHPPPSPRPHSRPCRTLHPSPPSHRPPPPPLPRFGFSPPLTSASAAVLHLSLPARITPDQYSASHVPFSLVNIHQLNLARVLFDEMPQSLFLRNAAVWCSPGPPRLAALLPKLSTLPLPPPPALRFRLALPPAILIFLSSQK